MASAKTIEAWFRDLREGTAKKRESAAKRLVAVDAARARAVLLEVLDAARAASRRPIGRSLCWVADAATALRIAADRTLTLVPERLTPAVLAELYEDLRRELPALDADGARERLAALEVLAPTTAHAARLDDHPARREALAGLLLAVLDDARLPAEQPAAAEVLRRLGSERGSEALLRRWIAGGAHVGALTAFASWARVGCPDLGGGETRLVAALVSSIAEETQDALEDARLDVLLPRAIPYVPPSFAIPLLVAIERRGGLPDTAAAAVRRVLDLATETDALLALLDDRRLTACHRDAAEALMARGPIAARAVIERAPRLGPEVRRAALAKAAAADVYALLVSASGDGFVDACWYDVVVEAPGALRDPRWMDLAANLHDGGRALYVAIARDPSNDARADAVAMLSQRAAEATDRLQKRHALYALGETGHPAATTALVAALDDHDVGDSAPLVCTALAQCGDTRAIPVLERRLHGPHASFVRAAIVRIRERAAEIHASVLLAACQDDDPTLADLARRARDGDTDAAVVLEDALRERGRL
ncbi:MAG: HEAT repeat domain-containing protein [Labilithrix sp.]|nr:HEAT repeat domain-containing protein [Labilithrix sp.]MCW5813071.1 HEAT repeat domain-containing protein [Labilithrix sp.]